MGERTASLGMYDRPELRAANDRLWQAIAERLRVRGFARVPARLDHARSLDEIWDDDDLLLAQCCGYPLVTGLRDRLRYVATPRYSVAGCSGADYRSRIIVRIEDPAEALVDLKGRRAAVNEWRSNSGMNLFRAAIAPLASRAPFFSAVVSTGSHDASVRAVADRRADVAAIDVISFAHMERWLPEVTHRVRTIAWTVESPGLPLVSSVRTSDEEIATLALVLGEVAADPAVGDALATLAIGGFERIPLARYDALAVLESRALGAGYPTLAWLGVAVKWCQRACPLHVRCLSPLSDPRGLHRPRTRLSPTSSEDSLHAPRAPARTSSVGVSEMAASGAKDA